MFDVMKARILLFEGYWDRRLFEIFIEAKKISNEFESIGIAHGSGVDDMPHDLQVFLYHQQENVLLLVITTKKPRRDKKNI